MLDIISCFNQMESADTMRMIRTEANGDPAKANELIRDGYYRLSVALGRFLHGDVDDPENANFATFATWSAQSLRPDVTDDKSERLPRRRARWLYDQMAHRALTDPLAVARNIALGQAAIYEETGPAVHALLEVTMTAVRVAQDEIANAVVAGDKPPEPEPDWDEVWKVVCARLIAHSEALNRVANQQRLSAPDVAVLQDALAPYFEVLKQRLTTATEDDDRKKRAELILLGNLRLVAYEQRRLQPVLERNLGIVPQALRLRLVNRWLGRPTLPDECSDEGVPPCQPAPRRRRRGVPDRGDPLPVPDHGGRGTAAPRHRLAVAAAGPPAGVQGSAARGPGALRPGVLLPVSPPGVGAVRPVGRVAEARSIGRAGRPNRRRRLVAVPRADELHRQPVPFPAATRRDVQLALADPGTGRAAHTTGRRRLSARVEPVDCAMSTRPLSPEATERLDRLARLGDDEADDLVRAVVGTVPRPPEVGADDRGKLLPLILAVMARDIDDPQMPAEVHDFLCAGNPEIDALISEQLDRIKRAQNFFDDNGVMIITALFHASLPEAYLGRRGVQVLDATGELFNNWTRRIQETGQFLVNVMSPTPDLWREGRSSLSSGEFGARVARRVRLTHAAIRWMLDAPETINHHRRSFQTLTSTRRRGRCG